MKNTVAEKEDQDKIWNSITRQCEFITGAQISNSFIVLMALSQSKESLSTTQVSEIISTKNLSEKSCCSISNPCTSKM